MLDPLTALGLASNVFQLADFCIKLISEGVELYNTGSTANHDELELVTKDLTRLTGDIVATKSRHAQSGTPGRPPSKDETAMLELAASCKEIGEQLLALLGSLKVEKSGKTLDDGIQSFRIAMRSTRKKGQIQNVEKRLKKIQEQLGLRTLALLSNEQSRVYSTLKDLSAENRRTETNVINKIDELQNYIISALEGIKSNRPSRNQSFGEIAGRCFDLAEEGGRVAAAHKVLRSLNFQYVKARQTAIKKAHESTFEWIFQGAESTDIPQLKFMSWVRDGDGIFWISGKAGSGKSTLMKLLCDHENVRKALETWAGGRKLLTANFFFWSPGNEMQKSQRGLLQSFLYQILKECPELIPSVCPSRWSGENLDDDYIAAWTRDELLGSFENLMKQDRLTAKFCFFVDGLDEYDGEEGDIIKILRDFAASSNVKICVSSRPWNAFEKAFGENLDQKFLLQDFTKDDIRLVVKRTLLKDESFLRLARHDNRYTRLIEDIVERARGVFLWVYLVLRSLLRGLTDDNTIALMHKRLDSLPVDLEKFFKQMMDNIEDIYREETARIFLLIVHADSPFVPLNTTAFWFFDQEINEPNYAMKAKIETLEPSDVETISQKMRTYINARCKDLLEVNIDQSPGATLIKGHRVDFLHRTVRDFLLTNDMLTLLQSRTSENFDARESLCKLTLAQIKALPNTAAALDTAELLLLDMTSYAYEVEIHREAPVYDLLNELDRSLTLYLENMRPSKGLFANYGTNSFLVIVARAGLCMYVGRRLDKQPELIRKAAHKPSLLEVTIHDLSTPTKERTDRHGVNGIEYDVDMARLLFARGAKPNVRMNDGVATVWESFLSDVHHLQTSPLEGMFEMAEMFIYNGADMDLKYLTGSVKSRSSRQRSAGVKKYSSPLEILEKALPRPQFEQLEALSKRRRQPKPFLGRWISLGWRRGIWLIKRSLEYASEKTRFSFA